MSFEVGILQVRTLRFLAWWEWRMSTLTRSAHCVEHGKWLHSVTYSGR